MTNPFPVKITKTVATGTSLTGANPVHAEDDYLLRFDFVDNTADDIALPGWTGIHNNANSRQSVRASYIKCVDAATASGVASFSSSANATAIVIRITGADLTNFLDTGISGSGLVTSGSGATISTAAGSVINGDVLCFVLYVGDGTGVQLEPGPMRPDTDKTDAVNWSLGWFYVEDAGAIPTFDFWCTRQNTNQQTLLVPIRMQPGNRPARIDSSNPGITVISPGTGTNLGWTRYPDVDYIDPTSDVASVDSITTSFSSPSAIEGIPIDPTNYGWRETAGSAAGTLNTVAYQMQNPSSLDMTGMSLSLLVRNVEPSTYSNFETLANHGLLAGIGSDDTGAGAYRLWDVGGQDCIDVNGVNWENVVIDISDVSALAEPEINSFDITNVDRVFTGVRTSGGNTRFCFSQFHAVSTIPIIGGNDREPSSWSTLKAGTDASLTFCTESLGNTTKAKTNVNVGNGAESVNFVTGGESLLFAETTDLANNETGFQAGGKTLKLLAKAGDKIHINDPVEWGTPGTFSIDSGSSGGDWSFDSGTLNGLSVWDVGADIGQIAGLIILRCGAIDNVDLLDLSGGCTITRTSGSRAVRISAGTEAALQTKLDRFANCLLSKNPVALEVVFTHLTETALSLSFDAIKGSGNTKDIHFSATASGCELTATMQNGASLTTFSVEDDESVVITTPINFIVTGVPNGNPYWCFNQTDGELVQAGIGDGNDFNIPFTQSGKSIIFRAGGDQSVRFESVFVTGAIDIPIGVSIAVDPFRAVNDATALAYTGITVVGDTSVDYTGTRTIQEVFDYCCAWGNSATGLPYDIPQSTADGTTILLDADYTHDVNGGTIKQESKEWSGAFTVSGGGLFEHRLGAIWESAGNNYYATHFYINVRSNADESDTDAAVIAFVETDSDTDVTYSTLLSNGGVITNVDGDAEGYAVYRIGAMTYTGFKELIGEYSFDWFDVPVALNGSPIGSAINKNVVRLVPDSNVGLSKAAGLAVAGITANHTTKLVNVSGKTNAEAHDNLKARQSRPDLIDTGVPGYMSYYQAGLIIDNDGSFFNALSDWTYENLGGTGVWKGGTINLDTPGVVDLDVNGVTFDYEADGTYTHSANQLQGTITLDTTNDSTVTAAVGSGKTISNADPANITVDESENFISTIRVSVPDEYAAASIANSVHRVLYAADIDTASAVTVNNASDVAVTGDSSDVLGSSGSYYIEFDYAYDNNDQAGLAAQTDKSVVLRMAAVGRRFKELPFVITRNALINQTAEMLEDFNAAAA